MKVIIRQLPTGLTEDIFKNAMQRFLPHIDGFYFASGSNKHSTYSRAYINFKNSNLALEFIQFFDGHIFVDNKGIEHHAVTEFAPYQKMPKEKKKKDIRENTIESDPDYKQFLESLNQTLEPLPSAEIQLERRLAEEQALATANGGKTPEKTTPLLEDLKMRKALKAQKMALRSVSVLSRGERRKRDKEKMREREREKEKEKSKEATEKPKISRNRKERKREDRKKRKKKEEEDDMGSKEDNKKDNRSRSETGYQKEKKENYKGDNSSNNKRLRNKDRPDRPVWVVAKRNLEPGSITIHSRVSNPVETTDQQTPIWPQSIHPSAPQIEVQVQVQPPIPQPQPQPVTQPQLPVHSKLLKDAKVFLPKQKPSTNQSQYKNFME